MDGQIIRIVIRAEDESRGWDAGLSKYVLSIVEWGT